MKISLIVPCYNAISKIGECLKSIENQTFSSDLFEVIFVDDCSNDGTFEFLKNYIKLKNNYYIYKLNKNSGSPSKPRNMGVTKAKGEYVFFLDADDSLFPDTLESYYEFSCKNSSDIIRGYLISDNGENFVEFNRLSSDFNELGYYDKVKNIVKNQTLTPPQLIRRSFLIKSKIKWRNDIRMGEDTLYALALFTNTKNISYIDHATYLYNQKVDPTRLSSTQTYGRRELENHLLVWNEANLLLSKINLSFYELRLRIAIQSVILSILKYYTHDLTQDLFCEFSEVVKSNMHYMYINKFNKKFKEIILAIEGNKFEEFSLLIKPKLLIAGYDLKFINLAIPFLSKFYNIKVDEWDGHEKHDESKSKELLNWADIIWCEWLLGNAVWYANNKLQHQKLVVRLHRFELTTKYVKEVEIDKIDKLITVSYYFFEKTIEILGIKRSKVTLIPNYLITEKYEVSKDSFKYYNLGMIGILPSRKGYYESLKLLKILISTNVKFKLHLYGKFPEELPWVRNNYEEMEYYNKCDKFIVDNNLSNHIIKHGWCDISKEVKNIGYVLSLSKDENIPESFHIAPAEGFCAGNIGVFLNWRGVEYIYPSQFIFDNVLDISKYICETNNNIKKYEKDSQIGKIFVEKNYSIGHFVKNVNLILKFF